MRRIIILFAATVLLLQFSAAQSEAYDYYFMVSSSSQTRGFCTLSIDDTVLLSTYIVNHQVSGSMAKHGGMLYVRCHPAPTPRGIVSESLGSVNKNKNKKTVTCDITCRLFPMQCTDATDYDFSCTLKESN